MAQLKPWLVGEDGAGVGVMPHCHTIATRVFIST